MADGTWAGWHFLAEGKKLRNGDGRDVIVGEWMAARMPARYPTPIIELLETEERLLAERQKLEVEIAPLAATTKGNR